MRLFHSLIIVSIKETKMFIPVAETLPSKWHETCQIEQKTQETAQIFLQTLWHLLKP